MPDTPTTVSSTTKNPALDLRSFIEILFKDFEKDNEKIWDFHGIIPTPQGSGIVVSRGLIQRELILSDIPVEKYVVIDTDSEIGKPPPNAVSVSFPLTPRRIIKAFHKAEWYVVYKV